MHLIRSAAKKNSTLKGTRMLPWKLELLLSPRLTANQLAQFVWSVALLPRLHTKPRSKYSWNCSEQLHKSYSNNCGKYSVHHIDTYIIGGCYTYISLYCGVAVRCYVGPCFRCTLKAWNHCHLRPPLQVACGHRGAALRTCEVGGSAMTSRLLLFLLSDFLKGEKQHRGH